MSEESSIAIAPVAGDEEKPVIQEAVIEKTEVEAKPELNEDGTPKELEKKEERPERTEAERERIRMQRGIDRRTRQLAEERAARHAAEQKIQELTQNQKGVDYQSQGSDSEPLSLTREQLDQIVRTEAAKLAPTLSQQQSEQARREDVVKSLTEQFGQERFDELASDLDDAVGGLVDGNRMPKPIVDAVFEAKDPASVIEWLANPDHQADAERISKLAGVKLGRAMVELENAIAASKAIVKPKKSNAPEPLETLKGGGAVIKDPANMTDKEFAAWRHAQIRSRR